MEEEKIQKIELKFSQARMSLDEPLELGGHMSLLEGLSAGQRMNILMMTGARMLFTVSGSDRRGSRLRKSDLIPHRFLKGGGGVRQYG